MAKAAKPPSELIVAAEALEDELGRMEVLSRAVRRIRLDTEDNITRAAERLSEALALPERMAPRLQALSAAMAGMQARQQAALEPLAQFAVLIQRRKQRLSEHMQAFAELGRAAGALNAALTGGKRDVPALADADAPLTEIAGRARALTDAARADDFPELAREADALAQRMVALRKRLGPRGPLQ
jgi:hypothetical protein